MMQKISRLFSTHSWIHNNMGVLLAFFFIVLSMYRIEYFDLWRDESFSVNVARQQLSKIVQITSLDVHPPLHLFMLHFWMKAFGESEMAVRMLSVFFHGITVFFAYEAAKIIFSQERHRLIATFFTATTPFLIYHSIEARAYSLLVACTMASIYFILRMVNKPAKMDFVEFTVVAIIGLYTHSIFLFALFCLTIWGLFLLVQNQQFSLRKLWAERVSRQKILIIFSLYVVVGVFYLPWFIHLLGQVMRVQTQGFWLDFEPMKFLVESFDLFFTSDRYALDLEKKIRLIIYILSTFGAVITVIGAFSHKKEREYYFGALLFLFLATVFLVSYRTPIYFMRYLVFVLPVVGILFAQGLQALEQIIHRKLIWSFVLIFFSCQVYLYYGNILQNENLKEHYQDALQKIVFDPNTDLILHPHGYTLHSFQYYARQANRNAGYLYDPERKLPHYEGTAAFSEQDYFAGDLSRYKRVWVPNLWQDQEFERVLEQHNLTKIEHLEFHGGVKLDLWRKF